MTIWVTERLLNLGFSRTSILWNLEESGEEVDIIAEHAGRTWIFELKDREFGAGDAYPFNYRKVRYKADEAVLVTTDKVAAYADRVFGELAGRAKPIYVQGLDDFDNVLKSRLDAIKRAAARRTLLLPSGALGLDLTVWQESRS